jgi:penicillin-binding protein 1C
LQDEVGKVIKYHSGILSENQIHNAAAVVMDIETGKVVAYIGNTFDPKNENGNQVDVIKAPRSTGSILKPFLYASMIEEGEITPNQLIEDVPMILSGYAPKNYNQKYDGVVPAHKALSRSLNVPIVKMLKDYGVQRFHQKLNNIGMTTVNRPSSDYGLSLILGGAEASLWDLCTIYGNMARTLNDYKDGKKNEFVNFQLYDNEEPTVKGEPFQPGAVWSTLEAMLLVTRPEEDGQWQQFNASQKIAWKTGTSYGFRDAWAIGLTPKYVVGVWVGNADGEGRPGLVGVKAAAPILFDIFARLPNSDWFSEPFDEMMPMVICKHTGFKASSICPEVDTMFIPGTCDKAKICPYHKVIHLDKNGLRVNSSCETPANMISTSWLVLPPAAEKFYKYKNPTYMSTPKYRSDCAFDESSKPLTIMYPKPQSNIYLPTLLDETEGNTIFEASHNDAQTVLYWHLDNQYIGETSGIHEMEYKPIEGDHVLTIIDEDGFESSVNFSVVK